MCKAKQFVNNAQEGQITWCKNCKKVSLYFNTKCADFKETEMIKFYKTLTSLKPKDYSYMLLGEPHVKVSTPDAYIGFCLNRQDVTHLTNLTSRALCLFDS